MRAWILPAAMLAVWLLWFLGKRLTKHLDHLHRQRLSDGEGGYRGAAWDDTSSPWR
jgi:hypothetical protein